MTAINNNIVPTLPRKVGRPRKVPIAVVEAELPKETKLATVMRLLKRPEGALLEELMTATGWQSHSVRGQISSAKKKHGLQITYIPEHRGRIYRIIGDK